MEALTGCSEYDGYFFISSFSVCCGRSRSWVFAIKKCQLGGQYSLPFK